MLHIRYYPNVRLVNLDNCEMNGNEQVVVIYTGVVLRIIVNFPLAEEFLRLSVFQCMQKNVLGID